MSETSPSATTPGFSSNPPAGAANVEIGDSLRAAIAGNAAAKLISASSHLFEAGGKQVLSAGAQQVVRKAAERGARGAILMATGPVLESASTLAKGMDSATSALSFGTKAAKSARSLAAGAGKQAFRLAGKEILQGAGKAAGVGFVLDGAVASIEAVVAVRNGSSDKMTAVKYVAKEATTGAIATGAGVLLGAGLVALTGGIAAPVVFAVGAIGSLGTKRLLRRFVR